MWIILIGLLVGVSQAGWKKIIVDSSPGVGFFSSIDVDKNNWFHIAYYDATGRKLKYARFTEIGIEIQTLDYGDNPGKYCSLKLDSMDRPHIVYYVAPSPPPGYLKYMYWTGSKWESEIIDSEGDVGEFCRFTIDKTDRLHVVYYDFTNRTIKYAKRTETGWETEIIDSEVGDPETDELPYDIATDYNNVPYVCYYRYEYDSLTETTTYYLMFASKTSTGWINYAIDYSTGRIANFVSIAVDTSNIIYVAYHDEKYNYDLKFASWTGISWSTFTLDTGEEIGSYVSLTLDTSGYPRLSYYDAKNADMKYLRYTGSEWLKETFDFDDIGQYSSIAIGWEDRAQFSFYNMTEDALGCIKWSQNPTLEWTGEQNYETDGLHPESGDSVIHYVFRIKYKDMDNDPAMAGYPKVRIYRDGVEVSSPTMNYVSGDPITGAIYTFTIYLSSGSHAYRFETKDVWGDTTFTSFKPGPDVSPPIPRHIEGYVRDEEGNPLEGIKVELSGHNRLEGDVSNSCITDKGGYYSFGNLYSGDYTVKPSFIGWEFRPNQRRYPFLLSNEFDQNFIARFLEGIWKLQAYPSPVMDGKLTVKFYLSYTNPDIRISFYDITGRLIREAMTPEFSREGSQLYKYIWDCKDERGRKVAPGVYLFILKASDKDTGKSCKYIKKIGVIK